MPLQGLLIWTASVGKLLKIHRAKEISSNPEQGWVKPHMVTISQICKAQRNTNNAAEYLDKTEWINRGSRISSNAYLLKNIFVYVQ